MGKSITAQGNVQTAEEKEQRILELLKEKEKVTRFLLKMVKAGKITLVADNFMPLGEQVIYREYDRFVLKYSSTDALYQTIKQELEKRLDEVQKEIDELLSVVIS